MAENTDVKFYMFNNTNAPQLTNSWGCLIDVLDACLVNGFGAQTVATLTAVNDLCTVSFGSAHNFKQYQVIEITGASQAEFNGEFRILSVPNVSSFTFQLESNASTSTATGTISCSLPPLGWQKPYSGTQKGVYRADNGLDPMFLRVDDSCSAGAPETGAKFGKITVCDAMSGIDSFDGAQMPFNASDPGRNHSFANNRHGWFKWYHATLKYSGTSYILESEVPSAGNRDWVIVGDKTFFLILNRSNMQENRFFVYGFGKVQSPLNGSDNYALLVSDAYVTTSQMVWHEIYDPICGGVSDYRPNSYVFYDKAGGANYQRIQQFSMPFVGPSGGNVQGISFSQYSGVANAIDSYAVLGKYIGFDMVGYAQNVPVFILPFVKSLAQIGTHLDFQNNGYLSFLSNFQNSVQPSYLLKLKGR